MTVAWAPMRAAEFNGGWGLVACSAGRYGTRPWRQDPTYKFILLTAGSYSIQTSSITTALAPGQFIVLNPGTRHRHRGLRGEKLLAELPVSLMQASSQELLQSSQPLLLAELPSANALIQRWVQSVLPELLGTPPGWQRMMDLAIRQLAVLLVRNEYSQEPFIPIDIPTGVARALTLIHASSGEALSLDDLAAEAHMDRYALAHAFKQAIGIPPHSYLSQCRIRVAAEALRHPLGRISDVAVACGFASLSGFNRAFKRAYGMSPSAYRGLHI